ncbi:carboxypeptidase-like regulatory domain-containing protein [Reichenbachiella sp.]|uniref:carboxypeptidase-like regulatory domain-containing protein n=1 Tax=Reichenbachiella sp. TaxID=2184521 RepID=UPI003BAE7B23
MKKQYSLSINKPCSEKWSGFEKTPEGGFCDSCQKDVIDFTKLTESEIIQFISKSSSNTCVRISQNQLNYMYSEPNNSIGSSRWPWLKAGMASLSLLFLSQQTLAKKIELRPETEVIQPEMKKKQVDVNQKQVSTHTVSGVVLDDFGDSLSGVNIILKGTAIGAVTDLDGKFKFPVEVKTGDILVFSFIGMETKEYTIGKDEPVTMKLQMVMDHYALMGELSIEEVYISQSSGLGNLWSKLKGLF